jgi:Tol biopolymer transport system component
MLMTILFGCIAKGSKTSSPSTAIKLDPGNYILFYSDRGNLPGWYLMKSDGSSVQPFNTSKLDKYTINGVTWISALQLFLFSLTDANQQEDFYLVSIQGLIEKRLTNTPYGESDATYSIEAKKFAYVCVESDLDICTVSSDGTNPMNLTSIPSREISPQWAKKGTEIVFTSNRSGVPGIWIVPLDGSEMQPLSSVLVPESNPAISPDGQKIAFQSQRDRNTEIYLMGIDGQDPSNLTKNPAEDTQPKWSPDGNYIAFQSNRDNSKDLYVMKADGSDVINITNTPDIQENNFIWMPDSSTIIYSAEVDNNFDIFSISRDGKNKINLTHSPALETDPQLVDIK